MTDSSDIIQRTRQGLFRGATRYALHSLPRQAERAGHDGRRGEDGSPEGQAQFQLGLVYDSRTRRVTQISDAVC